MLSATNQCLVYWDHLGKEQHLGGRYVHNIILDKLDNQGKATGQMELGTTTILVETQDIRSGTWTELSPRYAPRNTRPFEDDVDRALKLAQTIGHGHIYLTLLDESYEMKLGLCAISYESDWWMFQTSKYGQHFTICADNSMLIDVNFIKLDSPRVRIYVGNQDEDPAPGDKGEIADYGKPEPINQRR